MFNFSNVNRPLDGNTLSCNCTLDADMPFFNGHFPGMSIMPAIAQIEMLKALLEEATDWNVLITGGNELKFTGCIHPDDAITIDVKRTSQDAIQFKITKDASLMSKGNLSLADDSHD